MKLTLKEAIQSRKLKLIASELEALARKDRNVKKIVDQLKKGKEPSPSDITSLKGDTQDEVVMAFASVIGPSKTSDFLGESKEDSDIGDREGSQPAKYHSGLAKSTKEKRDAQFKKQTKMSDDDPDAYKPAPGDKEAKTKPSEYTKKFDKMFGEHVEELEEQNVEKALKNKSEKTGVAYGILKKVYDRGVAAWRTGHRPGTTPSQWGMARVNSFVTGGKTQTTADKDLWAKHKGTNEEFDLTEGAVSATKVKSELQKSGYHGVKMMNNKIEFKHKGKTHSIPVKNGFVNDSDYMAFQNKFESVELEEAKMSVGDTVRVKDKPKNVVDRQFFGKSGVISSKAGRDFMVKFPNGRSIVVDPQDLELTEEVKQMSKYLYSEAKHNPMHVSKAVRVAKSMGGNMTGAVEKIEKMAKGLSEHPKVKEALRMANEEYVSEAKISPMDIKRAMYIIKRNPRDIGTAWEQIEKLGGKELVKHPKVRAALHAMDGRLRGEEVVYEKAESEAQAIAARIALKHKREGTKPEPGSASAEMMKMSEKDLEDFTKMKKGAPYKVKEDYTELLYDVELNEAKKIPAAQLKRLRDEYGKIDKMNVTGPAYKRLQKFLDNLSQDELKAFADADIKWLSRMSKRRLNENVEDMEPASPDEKRMAMKQAEFIGYVGREIGEHLAANKEFPEWMQNKLSALHQKAKDLHANLGEHGGDMKEEVELHENFIRNLRQVAQRLGLDGIAWKLLDMEKDKAAEKIKQSDIDGFVKDAEEAYPLIKKNYQRYYKSLINKLKKAKGREALDMMQEIARYISKIQSTKKMRAEEVELDEEQKLFMFTTKPEAQKKAKEIRGKVLELGPKNFAVVTKDLTVVREEKMDPVNKDALKKRFKDRKDKDIDNDGDVDDSDEYLHNRRKAVSKAVAKEEKMDDVDKEALKKKFKDRKDKDIDNDGDVDSSDEYLHKRRQAVSKAMAKEQSEVKLKEKDSDKDGDVDDLDKSLENQKRKALETE